MNTIRFKELFTYKEYDKYWIATSFAMGASNLFQYVLSLYVLAITGSSLQFAMSVAIGAIPRLVLTPFAGVFGDRYPKQKLMACLNLLGILTMIVFAYLIHIVGSLTMPLVYALVVVLEIIEIFYNAPEQALIPEIVEEEYLEDAASFALIDDGIVAIICPFIGAYIYKTLKIESIFMLNACLSMICFLIILTVKTPYKKRVYEKKAYKWQDNIDEIKFGFNYMKQHPRIRVFILLTPLMSFTEGAIFNIVITYVLLEVFKVTPMFYSMYCAITVSMLIIAPLFIDPMIKKYRVDRIMLVSMLATTIAFVFIGFVIRFALGDMQHVMKYAYMILACDCITLVLSLSVWTGLNVYFQKNVEEEYRARVMSTGRMLRIVASSVGGILYGYLAQTIGVSITIWIGSIWFMLCLIYVNEQFKKL